MFWRFGYHSQQNSPIDTILDQLPATGEQTVAEMYSTLDQLLLEDDLLQECKTQNEKLIKLYTSIGTDTYELAWSGYRYCRDWRRW